MLDVPLMLVQLVALTREATILDVLMNVSIVANISAGEWLFVSL